MKFVYCLFWILVPVIAAKAVSEFRAFETASLGTKETITRLQHSFGRHEEGESLVGFEARTIKYPQDRNAVLTVNYPEPEAVGKRITAIIIYVNQTSTMGKAFVLEGGWDRNHVKFYVEANRTTLFDYDYKIYGVDEKLNNI